MKIIAISGKAGAGKDTTAGFLKEYLETQTDKRVLVTHYGDLVKYVCKTFFNWDGNKDEYGRSLLQKVGTDKVRAVKPEFWTDFVIDILKAFPDEWDVVIIPDVRFPNELERLREVGDVTHLRIVSDINHANLTEEQKRHPSETALDNVMPDFYLSNNYEALQEYRAKVMYFAEFHPEIL